MSLKEKYMEFYLGKENPQVFDSMYHGEFQCFFDNRYYPFGDQKCYFYFMLVGTTSKGRVKFHMKAMLTYTHIFVNERVNYESLGLSVRLECTSVH